MIMKRAMLCVMVGASVLMGATTVARAEEASMRVKLADLNLTTQAGAQIALARIRWSAGVFCEASPGLKALERSAPVDRCVGDMTRKGVSQLGAPLVTALLEGRPASVSPAAPVALAQR
jgi:UrcA family protein